MKIENLMTVQQFAKYKKVSCDTIHTWLKEGKVKTVTFLGKEFIDKSTYKG